MKILHTVRKKTREHDDLYAADARASRCSDVKILTETDGFLKERLAPSKA